MANESYGIPGARSNATTTSAGKSFINTVIARMPFSAQIIYLPTLNQVFPRYRRRQQRVNHSLMERRRSVRVWQPTGRQELPTLHVCQLGHRQDSSYSRL